MLWLTCGERLCRAIEVTDNGFKLGIAVLNNDSCIESLPLYDGIGRAHSETLGVGEFLKPSEEKSVSLSLTSVAGVTNVK